MDRRAFLTGSAALLASTAIPTRAMMQPLFLRHDIVAGAVYGRSPAMAALPMLAAADLAAEIGAFGQAALPSSVEDVQRRAGRRQALLNAVDAILAEELDWSV